MLPLQDASCKEYLWRQQCAASVRRASCHSLCVCKVAKWNKSASPRVTRFLQCIACQRIKERCSCDTCASSLSVLMPMGLSRAWRHVAPPRPGTM
eukprot:3040389-Amphidinium_carterae.1